MYFFNLFSLTILFATSCLVSANFHQIGRFRRQMDATPTPMPGGARNVPREQPEQPWDAEQSGTTGQPMPPGSEGQPGQPGQPEEPMEPGQPDQQGQPGQQGQGGQEMQCFLKCVNDFTQNLTAVFGDKVDAVADPEALAKKHADHFNFNSSMLTDICASYGEYSSCKDRCGSIQNPAIQAVEMGFAGVKYVCVDYFDAFQESAECYDKVQKDEDGQKCSESCSNMFSDSIDNSTDSDNNTPKSELTAQSNSNNSMIMAIKGLEMLCTYMPCVLDCTQPIYEKVCDSMDPFTLLQNYTRVAITGGVQSLSAAKMRVPESCEAAMAHIMEPGEVPPETTGAPGEDETTGGVTGAGTGMPDGGDMQTTPDMEGVTRGEVQPGGTELPTGTDIPEGVTRDASQEGSDVGNNVEVNNNVVAPETGASTSGSERISGRWLGAIAAVIIARVVMV